jgi:eukaryotic-like serine/threonine-protein kinase
VIGRTLSHYVLDDRLGAGGMGTVYLARDLALGRAAAIKVVNDQFDDSLKRRLLREADACAKLQHPAIATFFEAGEDADVAFIAMEYVRGETLRRRLGSGAVAPGPALAIGAALLEALHHAHSAGILHRDIKPENIMLGQGDAPKLLDFGIARVPLDRVETVTLTHLSGELLLGTFGYMSPEQLRGDPLDVRSDLFAVGAVLYEMIAGRPAFPGANASERVAAILTRNPPPLAGAGVSTTLNQIIMRALAKEPAARPRTASALLSELRAATAGDHAAALPQTLAVVDLRNLAGRAEDDWIGSGVAESLAADLTRVPGLTVVARPRVLRTAREASAAANGEPADPLEIGSLLGCRWVLSGSYQRLGPSVRITTTLAEVATGQVTAAEKLDGPLEAIFDLQDRLSTAVVNSLHLRLPTPVAAPAVERDAQAFEYYARGRRLWQRLEKGTFEQAGELYQRAIAIEPDYALALSGLAALHAMRFTFTTDPRELDAASEYARRAIAADPRLADPHVWFGYALWREGKADEALAEEEHAAALEPDNGYAPYFAACVQAFRGRFTEALPLYQRAVMREPPHGFAWLGLGRVHVALGNLDEARWCMERAIALEQTPGAVPTAGASAYLGECLRLAGDLPGAREACLAGLHTVERSDHMYRDSFRGVALCMLARVALDQGDREAARAALHQVLAHVHGRERTLGGGFLLTQAMAGLARAGEGVEWFEKARQLFDRRDRFNFSVLWGCSDETTLVELGRAALAVAHHEDGVALLARARDAGSFEARVLLENGVMP